MTEEEKEAKQKEEETEQMQGIMRFLQGGYMY